MLALFVCFMLVSWVFNLSTSSWALARRTSTLLWSAAVCLCDLFRFSISLKHSTDRKSNYFDQFCSLLTLFENRTQTLCKPDTCSPRASHFLADSSPKALCFSICACWMLMVFSSLARSSSIVLIFALSLTFSSSCNSKRTFEVLCSPLLAGR